MIFTFGTRIVEVKRIHLLGTVALVLLVMMIFFIDLEGSFGFDATGGSPALESPAQVENTSEDPVQKTEDKEEKLPEDCSMDGNGHEAKLMPSGNYFCRGNENLVFLETEEGEKACCVTP